MLLVDSFYDLVQKHPQAYMLEIRISLSLLFLVMKYAQTHP